MRTAVLKGAPAQPYFELEFGWGEKLPEGVKMPDGIEVPEGHKLTDWVKALPGRTWNPTDKKWRVTAAGPQPDKVLEAAGFEVDLGRCTELDIEAMLEPAARLSNANPNKVIVLPRLAGFDKTVRLLGGTPTWVKEHGWFEIGLGDLVRAGKLIGGINYNEPTIAAVREWRDRVASVDNEIVRANANVSRSTGVDLTHVESLELDDLVAAVGDVPEDFMLNLFPYQRVGALAAATGRTFIADAPGVGKCLLPGTRVLVDDDYRNIDDLWADWSKDHDSWEGDGGEWITLEDGPSVPTLDTATGKAERRKASHLYREHITAPVKTVTLDTGAVVRCTLIHRFWTPRGWTADLSVGDDVGISAYGPVNVTWAKVTDVVIEDYDGYVYDLTIPDHHNYVAEGIWTHNTRTALAAAEVIGWDRLLLVVPPVVLTHWMRQARDAEMAKEMPIQRGAKNVEVDPDECWIMVKKPGLKDRGTPVRGILITADSLLASRAELVAQVASWHPEILIFDESHRAKTWDSTRSKVMREVAARIRGEGGRCMCLTGTPMPSGNHAELAAQLDITGHLDTVFGGYRAYMETYCRKNSFNQWESRANTREELGRKLYDYVMIRRKKRDVLKDLPSCMVVPMVVDVDIKEFHEAHLKVMEKIDKWLDRCMDNTGILPDEDEIKAWANQRLDVISPMRVAAGLAKLPAAIDLISEWVSTSKSAAKYAPKTWDTPLLVWVHHHDVIDALTPMLKAKLKEGFAVLDGTTPGNVKDKAIDDFQAGKLGVLVCGITAISVGVTLTRGSDMLYIESDWVPSNMEQSLGRQDRFGQTNPVIARIMVSPGTLDERLQHILKVKSQNVDATLGKEEGGPQFYVDMEHTGERGAASVGEIIVSLVHECIDNRKARR